MVALKDLMNGVNCDNTRHEALAADMDADTRGSYIANSTIPGVDRADFILLIGTNPRVESPVYNARIRKMFLAGTQARARTLHHYLATSASGMRLSFCQSKPPHGCRSSATIDIVNSAQQGK